MSEFFIKSNLLSSCNDIIHAFSTAKGGVQVRGKFFSVPPSWLPEGAKFKKLLMPKQVHGNSILCIDSNEAVPSSEVEADGIATSLPELMVGVVTADCVPILFCDGEIGVVGALHAGWRGTLSGIAAKAVGLLVNKGSSLKRAYFAIGPSIRGCCYSVPFERVEFFANTPFFKGYSGLDEMKSRGTLDLALLNSFLLTSHGIDSKNIDIIKECTCCSKRWHSYRRDGDTAGRQINLIGLKST